MLIDTKPGHGSTHMFARLEPCAARRADGLVCEASQAAPAPPPGAGAGATGAGAHWRDPAPPPPPAIRAKSIRHFVNTKVRPLTEAICTEATEGRSHRAVCLEMAEMLSEWRVAGYVPGVVGFCEPEACWHSCAGASGTDGDGWRDCRFAECADTPCLEFLLRCAPSCTL